jgi:hypothetical protein
MTLDMAPELIELGSHVPQSNVKTWIGQRSNIQKGGVTGLVDWAHARVHVGIRKSTRIKRRQPIAHHSRATLDYEMFLRATTYTVLTKSFTD